MAAAATLRNIGRAALRQRGNTRLLSARPCTTEEKKEAAVHLTQIESKKEELFQLMASFERRFRIRGSLGKTNGILLEQLSMAVDPKPHDPHWRSLRGVQRFHSFIAYLGFYTFCTSISIGLPWLITDPKPKKIALDVWSALQQ